MYAAVDIGGTKTLVASFTNEGELTESIKFPTPQNYSDFKKQLADSVAKLSTADFLAVGAAAPVKFKANSGFFATAANLPWRNEDLQDDIEKLFDAPTAVLNDAKAATLSEARAAGNAYEKVLYITVSTGIGVGMCVNGNLDPAFNEAEAGWMIIEHEGKMVPWETVASGKAIVTKYGQRASELTDQKAWDDIARLLSKGLIGIIAIAQPDLIIFGGGVGAHLEKFEQPLKKHLSKFETPLVPIPPITKAKHPEEAVVYGCYELAKSIQK